MQYISTLLQMVVPDAPQNLSRTFDDAEVSYCSRAECLNRLLIGLASAGRWHFHGYSRSGWGRQ